MHAQILIYVFGIIIAASLLLFGYQSFQYVKEKEKLVDATILKQRLTDEIEQVNLGDVSIQSFRLSSEVDEVCFYDSKSTGNPLLCSGCAPSIQYPLIVDAVKSRLGDNIFVLSNGDMESIMVDGVELECCDLQCSVVLQGNIKLRIEGTGDGSLISVVT